MGANKVWILNVGDLKPAEKEIEYFADFAKNVWSTSNTEISSIYEQNAKRDFNMNETDAKEYADMVISLDADLQDDVKAIEKIC